LCARRAELEAMCFACMLALKVSREIERWFRAAFGTTDSNPLDIILPEALAAPGRLYLLLASSLISWIHLSFAFIGFHFQPAVQLD
jgi:hypothetical protein